MTRRLLVAFAMALATIGGRAQSPAPQAMFRSTALSVSVDVSVKRGNNPVNGLAAADFRLWDDGVLQKVDVVTVEAISIDVTLVVDTSGSTAADLEGLEADLRKIIAMLRPGDRIRLLTIDTYVHQAFPMQDVGTAPAIEHLPIGVSSVYDAILAAMLRPVDPDRRHLVVAFTDGLDTRSAIDSATLRDVARRVECVLDMVLIKGDLSLPPGYRTPPLLRPDDAGFDRLADAAALTGGVLQQVPLIRDPVVRGFEAAFDEFRKSYLLRYAPAGVPEAGWHELRVEVPAAHGAAIRARKGYYGQ